MQRDYSGPHALDWEAALGERGTAADWRRAARTNVRASISRGTLASSECKWRESENTSAEECGGDCSISSAAKGAVFSDRVAASSAARLEKQASKAAGRTNTARGAIDTAAKALNLLAT
jgi:hypothetical protein